MSTLTAFNAGKPHDIFYAILWLSRDAEPGSKQDSGFSRPEVDNTPFGSPVLDREYNKERGEFGGIVVSPVASPGPDGYFDSRGRRSFTGQAAQNGTNLLDIPGKPLVTRRARGRSGTDRSLGAAESEQEEDGERPELIVVDYDKSV